MIARNKLWKLAPGSVMKYEEYQEIKLVDSIFNVSSKRQGKYET